MLKFNIDPILVHLGPLAISWYGLAVATGILVGAWLTTREAARKGLPVEPIMGAILGGALTGALLAWRRGLPIRRLFDTFAPGIVLGQAIGRFGCLFTGDTVGRPTDGTWGIVYLNPGARVPQLGVAYQPAFFYEQIWDLLVFAILWRLRGRITGDGQL